MDNKLRTVLSESRKCPYCIVKDGVQRCKKNGCKCNYLNCPESRKDDLNYGDVY